MLDYTRRLFGGRLTYTQVILMGIKSLYEIAREVCKLTQDFDERVVLFEWVRDTRDVMSDIDTEMCLSALRNAWESFRGEQYRKEVLQAADFLRRGEHLKGMFNIDEYIKERRKRRPKNTNQE